jgi:hypothetical protein
MRLSKTKSAGLALSGAALVTSGFIAVRRYMNYRQLKSELNSIPWDIPQKYSSWRLFFNSNPKE